ncbi:dihydrofolate reductase family protein [Microbacterium sp. KUDC0406]|uniref:dihydrofolate reductase family protein n=1 Tax=Microbacterium sp. KUDC0406 TaxID=2909588 RepID=UPI001F423A0C|nr:dihydrofolate reductase family protein [Microbacterium sp. KUDC0406]UJP10553.1 dihydrofolate reductase family protein [Microbacterium sp. KUDC0406]
MRLTTITQLTLDGVTQGNGGTTEEDRETGFERGGWARGAGDDSTRDHITATFQRADAFLFGRRTYDIMHRFWGTVDDLRQHPIGVALNSKPKYVASTTLTEPEWANTTVLGADLLSAVRELKESGHGELQVHGSSRLIQWLLEHDLIDEMELITVPVVLGQGARLFAGSGRDVALDLVSSRSDSRGVMIQTYRPAGRPEYATF